MSTTAISPRSPLNRNAKKTSVAQTYFLACTARGKLSSEASRADHNLRRLVGHANLLDSLMLEMAEAEREHETWFNQFVSQASKPTEQKHIQWADAMDKDPEEDWRAGEADSSDSSGSDSDASSDEEIKEEIFSRNPAASNNEVEEFEDDGEEDYEDLALHLTLSHSTSPPDLEHDPGDSSDDDSLPPSPPVDVLPSFSEKQQMTIGFYPGSLTFSSVTAAEQQNGYDADFFLSQRMAGGLISAINVY
jgi:hypothetical protein